MEIGHPCSKNRFIKGIPYDPAANFITNVMMSLMMSNIWHDEEFMTSQFDDVIINEIKTCDWFTADDIIKISDVTQAPANCC